MSRHQLVILGCVYTVQIAAVVAFVSDPPAGLVFGVAVAWFSIGRAWDRLPSSAPEKPIKWGRQ